jgi:2-keto-myo-inositol isomerase
MSLDIRRQRFGRRRFIQTGAGILGACAAATAKPQSAASSNQGRFRFGLNTGTLRGFQLGLAEQIDVAAAAGYAGIEPWLADISKYATGGGSLKDLRRRCGDRGLEIYSAIGFAQWIVDDDTQRAAGVEQMKRDMALVAELGGTRIAAPPAGANRGGAKLDSAAIAERYRVILDAGREAGVVPQLEIWGHSTNVSHLAEALAIAVHSGHADACVLADVYHLYKGGTAPAALHLLSRKAAHVFHMNDYPATPDRAAITDAHRIWPGDGVAPLKELLGHLVANDCSLVLSLELFNAEYWKLPVAVAARTGLAKMVAAVSGVG